MKANYDEALKGVLAHEGGYTDDAEDEGGPTNWGITIGDARAYWKKDATADDVKAMPLQVAKDIYKSKYWDKMGCDALPPGVDYCVFDYGINSGVGKALEVLRDEMTGGLASSALVNAICDERMEFLQGLHNWGTYGRGWTTRVREVRAASLAMAAKDYSKASSPPAAAPVTKPADLATKILWAMKAKNYPVAVGADVMNIIYVEGMDPDGTANRNRPNAFDSLRVLLRVMPDGKASLLGKWDAITHAGMYWETHRMNPAGAFHIALGPQTCWTMGTYHDMEALIQSAPISGTRDDGENFKREGKTYTGDYGVHHHWGYDYPKDDVGNSSAGCQVGESKAGHRQFIALLKTDARYVARPASFMFTSTVLTAAEVLNASAPAVAAPVPTPAPSAPSKKKEYTIAAFLAAVAADLAHQFGTHPYFTVAVFVGVALAGVTFVYHLKKKA